MNANHAMTVAALIIGTATVVFGTAALTWLWLNR
jgi:hypothetical protein